MAQNKTYGTFEVLRLNSIFDGDTFNVDIASLHPLIGDNIAVRIARIDTPEINSFNPEQVTKAAFARDFLKNLLSAAKKITLENVSRDKYFRIVADVFIDGKDLAAQIVAANHGIYKKY